MNNAEVESLTYELEDIYLRIGSLLKELPKQYHSINKDRLLTKENQGTI